MKRDEPAVFNIDRDRLFKWLFVWLLVIAVALVLLDAFVSEFEWVDIGAAQRLVNITREDSIPNFYSSYLLLAVGTVLLLITLTVRRRTRGSGSRVAVGWAIIAGLFIFLGIDDATKLHERIGTIFSELVTDDDGDPAGHVLGRLYDVYPSYTWQLVLGPFLAAVGLFLLWFLYRELPSWPLRGLIVAGVALFFIAEAMDFIEGLDNEIPDTIGDFLSTSEGRVIHFSTSVEEFLEMTAAGVFLWVFLRHLVSMTPSITFQVGPEKGQLRKTQRKR